jgi:hypothetical protein
MNSFAERVECPMVMTINGFGDAHSFMPHTRPAPPIPNREYRPAASSQFRGLTKTFQQHLEIRIVRSPMRYFFHRHVPPQLVEEIQPEGHLTRGRQTI